MPFTTHQLEAIREGNGRVRCILCDQTWSNQKVRSACPGVPVYPFEETPVYLKTLTALEREHKSPPNPDHWDGAYRILRAPYYRLLYDEREAMHKPLTEKRIAAIEKRKEDMREKYTCRLCGTFHTNRYERRDFSKGVCRDCQHHIRRYNEQIIWAQSLIENGTIILDIQTEPEMRPYSNQEERLLLTGYTSIDLESGMVLRQADMRSREDLHYIKHLVCPQYSPLVPYPWVLTLYPSALLPVRYELERNVKDHYLFNPNLDELLVTLHLEYVLQENRPMSVYGHRDLPWKQEITARQMLEHMCRLHGLDPDGTNAGLMRLFVLHLAELETIELDPGYQIEQSSQPGSGGLA